MSKVGSAKVVPWSGCTGVMAGGVVTTCISIQRGELTWLGGRQWREPKCAGSLMRWPGPFNKFPNKFLLAKLSNLEQRPLLASKISKLCIKLDLNILSNFPNWLDFKISIEFMLKSLEHIQI
jgi:hypothetical protein